MEHTTGGTPEQVSLRKARESASRLRALLELIGVPREQLRQVTPASNINSGHLVRMGTWDPAAVDDLADRIEELQSAMETTPDPPHIRRRTGPPLPPAAL